MDKELFELCKEVYKRFPEWIADDWYYERTDPKSLVALKVLGVSVIGFGLDDYDVLVPRYTSDYLLEKLPLYVNGEQEDELSLLKTDINWGAGYYRVMNSDDGIQYLADPDFSVNADTPLKALLKLAIALNDAGEPQS